MTCALILEHRSADLDGLERESGGTSRSSRLPDGAVWFDRPLVLRGVRSQEDIRATPGTPKNGSNSAIHGQQRENGLTQLTHVLVHCFLESYNKAFGLPRLVTGYEVGWPTGFDKEERRRGSVVL